MQIAGVCLAASVSLNALLLYLLTKTQKIIGNYRYLLAIYSCFLMFFNLLDVFMLPAVHIHKAGFIYFATSPLRHRPIGLILAACQSVSQGVIIALLSVNFVFRYSVIHDTGIGRYWYIWPIIVTILMAAWMYAAAFFALANAFFDCYFRDSVLNKYQVDTLQTGYYAVVYWKEEEEGGGELYFPSVFCLSVVGLCELLTSILIGFCGYGLYKSVRDASIFASSVLAKVNKDLFTALVLQTITPCFMVHMPTAILIFSPFFKINPDGIEEVQPLLISIFPIIDTLIVLVCFRAFRNTLKELIWRSPTTVSSTSLNLRQLSRLV